MMLPTTGTTSNGVPAARSSRSTKSGVAMYFRRIVKPRQMDFE
jgi:hypothetical protein